MAVTHGAGCKGLKGGVVLVAPEEAEGSAPHRPPAAAVGEDVCYFWLGW